ncbi:hypothetical protein KIN20_015683 [Parelaphostrongylus tenuis]|uniref:Uncharacterized protein n=1 Tax=Parelaphostrongylus tenuis TaxID=148309 RepID=A0AAD5N0Y2_PARTN|nr:hypothetical protein KIN20_015683 [Parelaphostrongylus tenuis]
MQRKDASDVLDLPMITNKPPYEVKAAGQHLMRSRPIQIGSPQLFVFMDVSLRGRTE